MAQRRSRDELRELLLDVGVELLTERNVDFSIDALGYRTVFDHLEKTRGVRVTYGSVHERIWGSQREYQLAVLTAAVHSIPEQNFDAFAGPASRVIDALPLDTPAHRRYAAQELTRVAMNANWESSPPGYDLLRTLRYLCATLDTTSETIEPLLGLIAEQRARTAELYSEVLHQLVAVLGLRARAPLALDEAVASLALASNATIAGLDLDSAVAPLEPLMLATGPDGQEQSWHRAAFTTWVMTRGLLELDGELDEIERAL